jgi:hypothetical protein
MIEQMGPERTLPDVAARILAAQSPEAQSRLIKALIERLGPEKFAAQLQAWQQA